MITQNDQQFLEQFEKLKLTSFDHVAHLRLGFLCLEQDGLEVAIERVGRGLQTFATYVGATDKYHQTITEALVRLLAIRQQQQRASGWKDFLEKNPDMVNDAKELLLQHYSADRLFSPEARTKFLEPNRLPLEETLCTQLVK